MNLLKLDLNWITRMSKRVYVSGPMSIIPGGNLEAFHEASDRLREAGYFVVSPAEMNSVKEQTWEEYLEKDLILLLNCDGIALLPQWEDSRGAKLELAVALKMGKFVLDATTLESLE